MNQWNLEQLTKKPMEMRLINMEIKHGQVNVAILLDCGHYMLDDKEDTCPDFVRRLK